MRRRDFLRHLGAGALAAGAPALSCGPSPRSPNVVLINVDDLGWRDLACFGNEFLDTPNIDRLCAQGVKFTNAYAACAVCSPTRASIMTGRYPPRTGVTDWIRPPGGARDDDSIDEDGTTGYVEDPEHGLLCPPAPEQMPTSEVTIAEVLKDAGYATAHIGKWHLGPRAADPEKQGFDVNLGGSIQGQTPSYWDPYRRKRAVLRNMPPRLEGEYLTDREASEAVDFIRVNRDRPFFLNLWTYAVHAPFEAKPDLVEKYEKKGLPDRILPVYAAMIESVDQAVGTITDALDELGLANDTLVILTSDNGGFPQVTSNRPLRAGKGHPYEGGIRIPQIIRWSGTIRPAIVDVPVTSVDLFPTICDAAGLRLPFFTRIDGRSLVPAMQGTNSLEPEAVYWHYPHYWRGIGPYSIVRKREWKLIRRYEGEPVELFNLARDIGEMRNRASRRPEIVAELDGLLTAWLKDTGAILPIPKNARSG